MIGVRRAAASGGAVLVLAGSAFAANEITGRERAPAAAAVTIDSSAPLFSATGLVGGERLERCTVLTNEGPQPADVTLFSSAAETGLSPWLDLELVRGSLPPGTAPGDCTGFDPDPDDFGSGTPGVVFRGALADLPSASQGIADPTRWAVGERHAYRMRVHFTGGNAQQGRTTVQSFFWGATPFDDRPLDPVPGDGPTTPVAAPDTPTPGAPLPDPAAPTTAAPIATPTPDPAVPGTGLGGPSENEGARSAAPTIAVARQCRVLTFPDRSVVGARAISRPVKVRKAARSSAQPGETTAGEATTGSLSSSDTSVVTAERTRVEPREQRRRAALLAATRAGAAGRDADTGRSPVLVVRLSPAKDGTLAVRVGLRKDGRMTSPRRWRWVRIRLNATAAPSTLTWPFTATAKMDQLRPGYNQLDLILDRGVAANRVKGLPRLMRRSFAFTVGEPTTTTTPGETTTDCTLG